MGNVVTNQMIGRGDILIETGTLLPEPLRLETESTPSGWVSMANHLDRRQIGKELTDAGWIFFYMADALRATAFGFDRGKTIQAALKRLIAAAKVQACNSLEIDDIETHSFLGLPYMSISAHSRHIQKGPADSRKRGSRGSSFPTPRSST